MIDRTAEQALQLQHPIRSSTIGRNDGQGPIIHSYEEWGEECVNRLNGMFAFCIWDNREKRFFCARDRLGIKPFYYYYDGTRFIFGSEIKSILEVIERRLNPEALYHYLTFRYTPPSLTMFDGIKKLPPGHTLKVTKEKLVEEEYWDISFGEIVLKDERDWIGEFRGLLKESVKRWLMSDVPLGVFLSGGLDSSAVLAMMSEMVSNKIKTFSVAFDIGGQYSELSYARLAAQRFGTEHYTITPQHLRCPRECYDCG
ncbi:MAG: asparagine synthase-related protein, partial [bacterium]|nr:asparagine synthase-related protein [bacterium]